MPLVLESPPGQDFVLTEDGRELATFIRYPSIVVRLEGRTLIADKYAPGFHLALLDDEAEDAEQPVAWYAGGGGFGGSRIVLAPDHEYKVKSRFPLGVTWKLREGRVELGRMQAVKRGPNPRWEGERGALPEALEDRDLLIVMFALVVLVQGLEPMTNVAPAGPMG
jgi:hypothetical protein